MVDVSNHTYFALEKLDTYVKYRMLKDMEYGADSKEKFESKKKNTYSIISQNVRGFAQKDIAAWMAAWRRGYPTNQAEMIFLQETHVDSFSDGEAMAKQWALLWGKVD